MLKKVMVGFLVLVGLGLPVWGQEGEGDLDADWTRALEIREEVATAGEFASEAEFVDAWIEALRQEFGSEHRQVRLALHKMGMFFYEEGQYSESVQFLEQLVELSVEVLGIEHPETLTAMNDLAHLIHSLGDLARALKMQKNMIPSSRR